MSSSRLLLVWVLISACSTLVTAQVSFNVTSSAQTARTEGQTEAVGSIYLSWAAGTAMSPGSSITFAYASAPVTSPGVVTARLGGGAICTVAVAPAPSGGANCPNLVESVFSSTITISVTSAQSSTTPSTSFVNGDFIQITQVRVNVAAVTGAQPIAGTTALFAAISGNSSSNNTVTFNQNQVQVASIASSLKATFATNASTGPAGTPGIASVQTCVVNPITDTRSTMAIAVQEVFPSVFTSANDEFAFTPALGTAGGTTLNFVFNSVPPGLAITPVSGAGFQTGTASLMVGTPPSQQTSASAATPLTFTVNITGTNTSSVEKPVFNFTISLPNGAAGSVAPLGTVLNVTAQVYLGPVTNTSTIIPRFTQLNYPPAPATVATVSDCNAVPAITSISPSTVAVGAAQFTLTVNGTGFVSTSTVRFNNSTHQTFFGDSSTLFATISASDVNALGSAAITVFNPTPGGGLSAPSSLTVVSPNPIPILTSLGTSSAFVGTNGLLLNVLGSGFLNGATVQFSGITLTTTFGSSSSLFASVPAAYLATSGAFPVTVTNAAPTLAASSPLTFTVNNAVPVLTSLSPSFVAGGGSSFSSTISGSGFLIGAVAFVNQSPRTTVYGSASSIGIVLTASDLAQTGTLSIAVLNPAPTTGSSNALAFTVTGANPLPSILSLSPATAAAGAGNFTLTVYGTGFVPGSTLNWSGSPRLTTFLTSQQLTASINAADILTAGGDSVTVSSPTPGGGTSSPMTFTVGSSSQGVVTAQSVNGGASLMAAVPVVLNLSTGTIGSLSVGLRVLPGAGSPPVTANLSFQNDAGLLASAPYLAGTATDAAIFWGSFNAPLAGNVTLGSLQIPIPATAAVGQTYTVQVTAAGAAQNNAAIPLIAGADGTVSIALTYLVGDTFPSTSDVVGHFGDGAVNTLDLLEILRMSTNTLQNPPKPCTDRFDAMDVWPLDTPTVPGGDKIINTLDLLATLRRSVNVDTTRPVRVPRGLACSNAAPESRRAPEGPEEGAIEVERSAIYLRAHRDLNLAGLALSLRLPDGTSAHFTPGAARLAILDLDQPGLVAMAWLDGITLVSGDRVLLGYVESAEQGKVIGVSANEAGGRTVRVTSSGKRPQ